MRFSITGGSDVTGSALRAPLRPALFDRLAVGVITVANSPERARNEPAAAAEVAGDYLREPLAAAAGQIIWEGDAPRETGCFGGDASCPDAISPSRSLTSSQAAVKPEADTLLPSVSGAYSPWAVRRSSNSLRSTYP